MERFTLQRDERHFGFWCAAGSEVDTFERSGTLGRNQLFRHILLPRGSRFWHDVDLDYLTVESNGPIVVYGHHFGDESRIEFSPRVQWEVWSAVTTWLLFPLAAPLFLLSALFRRLNRWMAVIPSEDMRVNGLPIVAGDRVHLRGDGSLKSLMLFAPRTIGRHTFETGHLQFARNGALEETLLYQPQTIGGVPCAGLGLANTAVRFWPDGTLRECVLAETHQHRGASFERGTRLRFDRDGAARAIEIVDIDTGVYSFRPEVHRAAASAAERPEPDHAPPTDDIR